MTEHIDKLERILNAQLIGTEESLRLVDLMRGEDGETPASIEGLLFEEPPPLDLDGDSRIADLYQVLWKNRHGVLARFYEPDRVYISRALYKLVLKLPADSAVKASSLLEAARSRFFLRIRDKWHRVRIEEVPTGSGGSETAVRSRDFLIGAVLREMRQLGLLDEVEAPVN